MKHIVLLFLNLIISSIVFANESVAIGGSSEYQQIEVNRLKELALDNKTQMIMLQQLLLNEGTETAYPKLNIRFTNDFGRRYKIFSVQYFIDSVQVYSYIPDKPNSDISIKEFKSTLSPGKHNIKAVVSFAGNDSGVFSYLSDYKINIEKNQDFNLERGQDALIEIRTEEIGNMLTDFRERANIEIKVSGIEKNSKLSREISSEKKKRKIKKREIAK